MSSTSINEILANINKKYGEGTVLTAKEAKSLSYVRIPTGFYSLDIGMGLGKNGIPGIPRGRIVLLKGDESTGKAQPLDSKVLTPSGYVTMGEITVGDEVVDGEGNKTKVQGVFPQGKRPIYKINFNDRTSIKVSDEHINPVHLYNASSRKKEVYELTTIELIKKFEETKYTLRVEIPKINCWTTEELLIDPYLLGFLIADGSLTGQTAFSNSEEDIINKVTKKLGEINYTVEHNQGCDWVIKREDGKGFNQNNYGEDSLVYCLEKYGLKTQSYNKRIPKEYLHSSFETRLELLRGLFDGDGNTPKKESTLEYSTSSKGLSEDFSYLVRSMGIPVTVTEKIPKYEYKGKIREGRTSYIHHMKVRKDLKIFSSEKHTRNHKPRTHNPIRSITSIEYIGEEECQCISVESETSQYITDNFTPTHNTLIAKKHIAEAQKMCRNCNTYIQAEIVYHGDDAEQEFSYIDKETGEMLDENIVCECGNPEPMKCAYMDAEGAYDPSWATDLGVDNDRVYLIQPEFAEEGVDVSEALLRSGEIDVLVVDSIAELVPSVEIEKSSQDQQMGVHARLMNKFMRLIVSAINSLGMDNEKKPTVVLINQKRSKIGVMFGSPETIPGGVGQNFRSSIIVDLRMMERINEDGAKWTTQQNKNYAGARIGWRTDKNKTSPPFQQGNFIIFSGDTETGYLKGETNTEEQIIDLAIKYGVITRSGAWFNFQDVKAQGKTGIVEELRSNRELFEEVKEATSQIIARELEGTQ